MNRGVFAVAGGKGGVGKTTASINLAAVLSDHQRDVIVVELDLGMANVVDFLDLGTGLTDETTLHDVLGDRAHVSEAIRTAPGGFDLLPSGVRLEGFAAVDVGRFEGVLETLRAEYDVVLIDTGAGLSEETILPLKMADGVVLVSTPRVAAVRDAEKTKQLAAHAGTPAVGVVFSRSGTGNSPPPEHLADFLGVELLGHVPRDEAVPGAQDAGVPVTKFAPDSEAATAYRAITAQLLETIADGSVLEGTPSVGDAASASTAVNTQSDATSLAFTEDVSRDATSEVAMTTEEPERQPSTTRDTTPATESTPDDRADRSSADDETETEADGQSIAARAKAFVERYLSPDR